MQIVKQCLAISQLLLFAFLANSLVADTKYQSATIRLGPAANGVEKKVAALLRDRLLESGMTDVSMEAGRTGNDHLIILLGRADHHPDIQRCMGEHGIAPLTELAPGPEGFLLQWLNHHSQPTLLAAGVDDRGCLYCVGELLRQAEISDHLLHLPTGVKVRTAPAFQIRGTQYGQSGVAKTLAHVRDWSEAETQRVILDYALAGANIFSTEPGPLFDFLKSYGLMTQGGFGANTAGGQVPPAWQAFESIGRTGYVCLSVPEARAYMLQRCEQTFKNSPTYDLVKFHGGDGGGCECDRCNPYGLTFIKLVEEMAAIVHSCHPRTRIYFTNQKFDDEDDQAIFQYLQEKPRHWLWAWGYGPGSDATSWQPGHRQTHRMDLFRYPGYGPYGLYPKEILHQLPPQQVLVYYNEITHWKYAQHGYIQMYPRADRNGDQPPHWSHDIYERRPDQYLTMVYNRLTFYAWPRYYHRVFNDLMPYGVGDITHSSGHHDHVNQWLWQRLLWSPRLSVEQVVDQYCRTWFGQEAAPDMARALFQLEENLQEQPDTPLHHKTGIDTFYARVTAAGQKMPAPRMATSWLWRLFMQKAALDKYIQLAVGQQIELQQRIEKETRRILQRHPQNSDINEMLLWLKTIQETPAMVQLRQEAGQLGAESDRLFGDRNEGYFNLQHDFIGLGWLQRQLERAQATGGNERRQLLAMIVDYEDSGDGGYYDNLGTSNRAPHVTFGYPYDHGQPYVNEMLSEGNRPSQRSMHFTQDEEQGVTLHYQDLDPKASYRIRFTFVRPWYQPRYADRMNQTGQAIFADDHLLAEHVELPLQMSDFFTFDIPKRCTADGDLVIRLQRAPDVARGDRVSIEQWRNSGGWGTLVSEVWLMKQ